LLDAVTPDPIEAGPLPGQWRQEKINAHHEDRLFRHLLVALSGEPGSEAALDQALEMARREAGQVFGLHLVSGDDQIEHELSQRVRSEFQRRCDAAGVAGKVAVEVGPVVRKLCDRARWSDLVVVHLAHPPGPRPLARLGSGLSTLIRRCPRPILAVPDQISPLKQALLAFDGSAKANEALFVAAYLVEHWHIPLTVVTVVDEHHPSAILEQARQYLAAYAIDAAFSEGYGPAGSAIIEQIETHQADLILMGGYGLNPVLEVTFGSTVDQVLRQVRRPVLICR
jgi:nucleotide-binding universal stress UspA family protein